MLYTWFPLSLAESPINSFIPNLLSRTRKVSIADIQGLEWTLPQTTKGKSGIYFLLLLPRGNSALSRLSLDQNLNLCHATQSGAKKKGLSNLVSPFPQRRKRANREQQRIKKKPRRGDGGVGKGNEVDEEIGEDIGGKSRDWCSHQLCCVWNDVFRIYLDSN